MGILLGRGSGSINGVRRGKGNMERRTRGYRNAPISRFSIKWLPIRYLLPPSHISSSPSFNATTFPSPHQYSTPSSDSNSPDVNICPSGDYGKRWPKEIGEKIRRHGNWRCRRRSERIFRRGRGRDMWGVDYKLLLDIPTVAHPNTEPFTPPFSDDIKSTRIIVLPSFYPLPQSPSCPQQSSTNSFRPLYACPIGQQL